MDITRLKEQLNGRKPELIGNKGIYSVLIPLVEKEDGLYLFFETRAKHVAQPGEVCFPGGFVEGNETTLETALRETYEEVGFSPEDIEILGEFDTFPAVGNRMVYSYVGKVKEAALGHMKLADAEVSEVFMIPVNWLLENKPFDYKYYLNYKIPEDFPFEQIGQTKDYKGRRTEYRIICWNYEGHYLWGLTAQFVNAFLNAFFRKESERI